MKKHLLIYALILTIVMAVGVLTGCTTPPEETPEDGWKPSGADILIVKKNTPITFTTLYGEPEELSKEAAGLFKSAVASNKLGVINSFFPASTMNENNEIIIGSSDRTASLKAKELYDKEKSGLYSWTFYYYDGKLAIYAEDKTSYKLAFEDLFERYANSDSLTVKDTLAECMNMTEKEYDEYLDAIDVANAEAKKKEHAKLIDSIKSDIKKQRTALDEDIRFDIRMMTSNLLTLVPAGKRFDKPEYDPINEHPRVMFTKDDIPGIRKALREDTASNAYFFELLEKEYDGILKPAPAYKEGVSTHNYNGNDLEPIMAKALAYQIYDDPYYGYQAIYAMKNYLQTLQIIYISGDQYRQFGDVGFAIACVYDWCYDLLTDKDKEQFITGTENIIFKGSNKKGVKFEIGFPPYDQSSFVGHGAEYQLLRDYLSFSIAVFDENPSWYYYTGARFFYEFVPARNCYFEPTGIAHQGTNYLSLRHVANIYSAWLSIAGMGVDPYTNLLETVQSFSKYEYAPGYIFTDGDGSGVQTTGNLRDAEFMAGYLYGDPTLVALAEKTLGDAALKHVTQGIGPTIYAVIRGKGVKPTADPYAEMDLVQYNSAPLGQYIVRESWNTADSAAVFMKLKERHTANHEHGDAGAFQIYYKGMLSSESGVYDNYGHIHTQKFYKESVSHNTLLVRDPRVGDIYYTGGQRTFTTPLTAEHWLTGDFATGTITGREHNYFSGTKTPEYAYIGGDITKAYESTAVDYVGRRMLTVYTGNDNFPMAFFVYDDISAKLATFKKTFLLQITSPDAPTIDGNTVITENGEGRLVLTCLTNGVAIEGVGGRVYKSNGQYDPDKSTNYLVNGKQLISNSKKDDGHWGRIEISLTGSAHNTFMNVIYVTDKGQSKDAPVITAIKADGVEGSTFGNVAAVFMTSRERVGTAVSFTASGDGEMKYYISGVSAGAWKISVGGKDCGTATATEEGGLLVFTAPSGSVTLTPAN